jgi:hypothetical protein
MTHQEEKAHQPAGALRTVGLAQILIRAAGARHGSAQFGPHESVADGDHRANSPADGGLGTAHRFQHEGNRQERADADHIEDVDGGGIPEADLAFFAEFVGGGGGVHFWS